MYAEDSEQRTCKAEKAAEEISWREEVKRLHEASEVLEYYARKLEVQQCGCLACTGERPTCGNPSHVQGGYVQEPYTHTMVDQNCFHIPGKRSCEGEETKKRGAKAGKGSRSGCCK